MEEILTKLEKLAKSISFTGVAVFFISSFFVVLNECYRSLSGQSIFPVNYLNAGRNYFMEKVDISGISLLHKGLTA